MKKIYTREYVEKIAAQEGFIKDNTEKVLRLIDVLEFINSHEELKGKLALKGGTAINLTIFDFPRLSVDIDLDLAVNYDKFTVTRFRKRFKELLNEFAESEGYQISEKSRIHYALDSFILIYNGTSGNKDNIKVEINYMNRVHILPLIIKDFNPKIARESISILSLHPIEIYASKMVALMTRLAPRDLYDAYQMVVNNIIENKVLFRQCFVFYNVCNGEQDADSLDFTKLGKFTIKMIRRQLNPMLSKNDNFDLSKAVMIVTNYLTDVFSLTESEKLFVTLFRENKFCPELLFNDREIINRIEKHPMILWRMMLK